jgi:glycerol-1-phosphate dehydrogenase [NAD(P)+]
MTTATKTDTTPLLTRALAAADDTKFLEVGPGVVRDVPAVFRKAFGPGATAILISDTHTMAAAGNAVADAVRAAGIKTREPYVIADPDLYAEFRFVDDLDKVLAGHDAIPVVVGAGTLNDLVKLAAHRAKRRYLVVATASSMDGYTAYGASITYKGSKQTFNCPAPLAVVADLDVIGRAPASLNASGYADLVAKITAGADWIASDVLGVEPIDATAWDLVQTNLRAWSSNAPGIPAGDPSAIRGLTEGLMMTGFAMQWSKTSRPASGAEHQFSHLWDMQHHTHNGYAPSHGFKVGIGTLAVTHLYDFLLSRELTRVDIVRLVDAWPTTPDDAAAEARRHFDIPELADKADEETRAKYITPEDLRSHLMVVAAKWPDLRARLRQQLIPAAGLRQMMSDAGAPTAPEEIGISRRRLRDSFRQAYHIRRRYTALDLAVRTGTLDAALDHLFGPAGPWPVS